MKSLTTVFAAGLLALTAPSQDATVTVLHGVPGLPAPVQVVANGSPLFSFAYGEQESLSLPAGPYALEVRLNGLPILTATANVNSGDDVSVIAHLDAAGTPTLSLFANNVTPLTLPSARLIVRHTAQAPAVDVVLSQNSIVVATIPNLANGGQAVAPVAPGRYGVELRAAGTSTVAFGPVDVIVENGNGYCVFAVGTVSTPSFTLLTQLLPLSAKVTVLHGIPGLGSPVTVRANSSPLFTFDFREVRGPLVVNPATYAFDVLLNNVPVLARNATLARGDDVTIVAHLDANSSPAISAFANNTTAIAGSGGRVTVRHLAAAPAVDVVVSDQGSPLATIPGLTNGMEMTASVPLGNFGVRLVAAGTTTTVFGPVNFRPQQNVFYEFVAIGSLSANTFGVELLQRDLTPAVPAALQTTVGGWGCGPTIAAVPSTFDYGQPFELVVTGAAANRMAIVNYGDSISNAGALTLPFALAPLGAPGCFVNTNAIAVLGTMTDSQGQLRVNYLVPRAFAGGFGVGYFQVGVMDGTNTLGWVATEYLQLD